MGRKPKDSEAPRDDKRRALTFPAPPGIAAELERLVADGTTLAAAKRHLAAEAAELLSPMKGRVRQIVGRRMGYLPEPLPPFAEPED